MKKIITALIFSSTLLCCGVPQSEYDKLKAENEQFKSEISNIEIENNELKAKLEEKKRIDSNHSEIEALKLLKDYYNFYNSDMIYRNPRIRRVNGNTFNISLEDCTKKADFKNDDFFWHSQVLTLVINEDGTYKVN